MKTVALAFCKQIEDMRASGKTIKQIRDWSYEQREAGVNIPYLAVCGKKELMAAPLKSQKDWYNFLFEQAPGCVTLTRYDIYVYKDKVEFVERSKDPITKKITREIKVIS